MSSRLTISTTEYAQKILNGICQAVERRLDRNPQGLCPVDVSAAFIALCAVQSCGKCVPCRVGLPQMQTLMQQVLDGKATEQTLTLIERTAENIAVSADCVIGAQAGEMALTSVRAFREDYLNHIGRGTCKSAGHPVPCVETCPANVNIPGYVALVSEGRYADAVRLIRRDNPFPSTCGLVCEHPCEHRCRRGMVDYAVNIRGLKRYAVEHAGEVPPPAALPPTGKRIAIIGGGPSGLTAAYYLALMGHEVDVFEQRKYLGGMLRYGIPSYRLPRDLLQQDINAILAVGVKVHTGVSIGKDGARTLEELREAFDSVYISIGAHTDKKMRIEGETARGVISSVDFLRGIGDGEISDLSGKAVVVVGGGNVAMDAARSAVRAGAKKVTIAYRRMRSDMPAHEEELDGAIQEGCTLLTMAAPLCVACDENDNVTGLTVQPQITGNVDTSGRPSVRAADEQPYIIPCDMIIGAIGQGIDSAELIGETDIPLRRDAIAAGMDCIIPNVPGIFSGGDCVTGPATVIRAIAAGKAAAANIDQYLGFEHKLEVDVEIPQAKIWERKPCGRVGMGERAAMERAGDFALIELGMTAEEAEQESSRCLRCDHFGCGAFREGRERAW